MHSLLSCVYAEEQGNENATIKIINKKMTFRTIKALFVQCCINKLNKPWTGVFEHLFI